MALNPIVFSHQVNERFRRYQLTAFPLTDRGRRDLAPLLEEDKSWDADF